ncbi:MAG: hypothetical protein K2X27_19885 [Candidatus Obscuribacterales bacterium]|nr:hypothetical protein [Candidatus Obscuribacterales bacterium]
MRVSGFNGWLGCCLKEQRKTKYSLQFFLNCAFSLSLLFSNSVLHSAAQEPAPAGESSQSEQGEAQPEENSEAPPESESGSGSREPNSSGATELVSSDWLKQKPLSSHQNCPPFSKVPCNSSGKRKAGVPCIPMMLIDDPNTLLVCDREANIRAEKRNISFSRGKSVIMVGREPLVVDTPLCSVSLPGGSAAIIEQTDKGLFRLDHLSGAPSIISVKRWKKTRVLSAHSGKEICIAGKNFPIADVLSADSVYSKEKSSALEDEGISYSERSFEPKQLLDKECLLQCDSSSFFQVRYQVNSLRNSVQKQELPFSEAACGGQSSMLIFDDNDSCDLHAVALEQALKPLPLMSAKTDSALLKFNGETRLDLNHPSVLSLTEGELLLSAHKLTFLKTPDSMIRIEPGSMVFVTVNDGVSKLRTIWEDRCNSVLQRIAEKSYNVHAGDECMIAPDLRSIYLSASKDLVGRRQTHYTEADERVLHFSEVSLVSLVQSSSLLSQLSNSQLPEDQALSKKLNKMAAILVQISASHGMYELLQTPQWRHEGKTSYLAPGAQLD